MIAGMVPVAIGLNEASKQRTSLGVAIIGGTISSTLLALVMIPVVYWYIDRFETWFRAKFNRYVRGIDPKHDVNAPKPPVATPVEPNMPGSPIPSK